MHKMLNGISKELGKKIHIYKITSQALKEGEGETPYHIPALIFIMKPLNLIGNSKRMQ